MRRARRTRRSVPPSGCGPEASSRCCSGPGAGWRSCCAVSLDEEGAMGKAACAREEELLEALQSTQWPETCDPALRDHVTSCASCTDLVAVVAPLLDEHRALLHEATVPSSAIVWWRAQMRSRREAAARAAQPISVALGISVACAAGLLATAL